MEKPGKVKLLKPLKLGTDKSDSQQEDSQMNAFKNGNIKIDETGITRSVRRTTDGRTEADLANSNVSTEAEKIELSADDFEDTGVVLGSGASGTVYKMLHKPTKTMMAVKKISAIDEKEKHLLIVELNTLMNCNHDNIIRCSGAFYKASHVYVAMEFMELGTLADLIHPKKVLLEQILGQISYQVFKGLEHLHKATKVVHRDIKPSNILVGASGLVKLGDFGVSGNIMGTQDTRSTFVGTGIYMSPERFEGNSYTSNSDVWSLGLTILECAVGYFPYNRAGHNFVYWDFLNLIKDGPVPQVPDHFSAEFKDFIQRCLTKDPTKRPGVTALLTHSFIEKWKHLDLAKFAKFLQLQHQAVRELKKADALPA